MVRSGKVVSASDQSSIGDLVAQASRDVSTLIRYEIALAKSELRVDGMRVAWAAGLVVLGLMVIAPGVILLCFAYAYFLHWAGAPGGLAGAFGFAGLTFVVLALCAVVVARIFVKRVTGMKLTRKTVTDDLDMLRRGEESPDGHGPAMANPRSADAVPGGRSAGAVPDGRSAPAAAVPGPRPPGNNVAGHHPAGATEAGTKAEISQLRAASP